MAAKSLCAFELKQNRLGLAKEEEPTDVGAWVRAMRDAKRLC
jgi:hypothetical protein